MGRQITGDKLPVSVIAVGSTQADNQEDLLALVVTPVSGAVLGEHGTPFQVSYGKVVPNPCEREPTPDLPALRPDPFRPDQVLRLNDDKGAFDGARLDIVARDRGAVRAEEKLLFRKILQEPAGLIVLEVIGLPPPPTRERPILRLPLLGDRPRERNFDHVEKSRACPIRQRLLCRRYCTATPRTDRSNPLVGTKLDSGNTKGLVLL